MDRSEGFSAGRYTDAMRRNAGYNMVEILIALLIVGIITITLMTFVNDYTQRYRLTQAKADLQRIAQAIQLAENASGGIVRDVSEPGGAPTTMIAPYIVEVPFADPWNNRFVKQEGSIVAATRSDLRGQAYIVDEGLGRLMCAGPDGVFSTPLGRDAPDNDADIVVDYRLNPSMAYVVQGDLFISTANGATREKITTSTFSNVRLSPDGAFFVGIGPGTERSMWLGSVDEQQDSMRQIVPRPGFTGAVDTSTYPIWFPRGGGILFVSSNDIHRYDPGLDRIFSLTKGGAFDGGDVAGQSRFVYNDGKVSLYQFTSSKGTLNGVAIAPDGRVAYNSRKGGSASGIYVVSSSGGDARMLLRGQESAWLPVTWLGTDVLVYMTDPAASQDKIFYRVRQDGTQNLPLHNKPLRGSIYSATPSQDGSMISFFISDTAGGVIKTDGSGFTRENPQNRELLPWSESNTLIKDLPPIWRKDSRSFFYGTLNDAGSGEVRVMIIEKNQTQSASVQQAAGEGYVSVSHDGFSGFKPAAMTLNRSETFLAAISASPPGIFIVPVLGPAGAFTRADALGLRAGETPVIAWLED